jgi:PadR family transcriptional regulator PadR
MASIRLTKTTIGVLEALLAATPDSPAWGLSICQDADLGSGTVYPILERLLSRGWIRSWPEEGSHPGRPARRYYELTGEGRAALRQVHADRAERKAMQAAAAERRRQVG